MMTALISLLLLLQPTLQASGTQGAAIIEEGNVYILKFDETSEGVTLEDFIKICQEATGKNFTIDDDIRPQLSAKRVRIFGTKTIPKADFYSFFQIVMFINNFVCTKVGAEPLTIIVVQPVAGGAGRPANLRAEAVYVLPEDLEAYADDVATPITTVLHLPNVDVRQLGNSLRSLYTDTTTQQAIPIANTNSIILQGFASNVVSLARFLQLVDREMALDTEVEPTFEVIPMEFAAAEDIADVLEQLLEATRGVNRQAQAQGATGVIGPEEVETRIITFHRTNSLLIMAMPDEMQNIKELVARLDVDVIEPERTYHTYGVENARADELAEVLEDFLQESSRVDLTGAGRPAQGGGQPGGGGGGGASPSRRQSEVVVVADPVSNSLLIAANKTRYEEILDLIRVLDSRQDQVLIETALIELTGRETLDIGVELGGAELPEDGETGGFGLTDFGLSELRDLDMDGVLDTRVPMSGVGLAAGILRGDDFNLPVFLAAMETRTDSNVLNVPSILVNNNGSASVASIDEQPTTTTTLAPSTGAAQSSFAGFEEAGITLRISPSISAANYLRLNVYLEVANFLGVAQDAIPAPRVTRTIETTVNVPDGDTMVIGGIITDNANHTRTQVPFLGSIPLVGALFRRNTDRNDRTTLYFFVTPHILKDRDFADLSEISYNAKLQAADRIGVNRMRVIDPDFNTAGPEVDLEGFEVPLYRSPHTGEVPPSDVGLDDPAKQQELLQDAPNEQTDPK